MSPYIFANDAAAYLTFPERAFGAEVVGRTAFMVSEAGGQFKPSRAAFYIYVERTQIRPTGRRSRAAPTTSTRRGKWTTGTETDPTGKHMVILDAGTA